MRFSVIIPLYNKAPYVAKAIQSVLAQTCSDHELIVVDDGSKDNSATIASQIIEGHQNCCLIHQENLGVSSARNNGVAVSHGDYLCFLDADDWWEPTFLEEMAGLIERHPDAGIYGTGYHIVKNGKKRVAPIGVDDGFGEGEINYCQVYAKTLCMPLWTGAVCVPRNVFEELGGFPTGIKLGEDFLLWIHVALKYDVMLLNKPLGNYNQDVDVAFRGTHHLHEPKEHMLWNLKDLGPLEQTNNDYKQLVDNLRTYTLINYLLDKQYRDAARAELGKVDWKRQPSQIRRLYRLPVIILQLRQCLLKTGSRIKQHLIRLLGI